MPIMWSRIHAELGLTPTELTYEILEQAVQQHLRESEDLDWKQALPPKEDSKRREFAKDVAAMANTRGGLIVFGVKEKDEQAIELAPLPNGERERQMLKQTAMSRIRPLVSGLQVEALTGEDPGMGLVVVSVPASPDAPHIVGEDSGLGVPFRVGSDTRWMSEHQLERAYRERFSRRDDDAAAVAALIDDVGMQVDRDRGVWMVFAARPATPLSLVGARPNRDDAVSVLDGALILTNEIFPGGGVNRRPVLRRLGDSGLLNPRVGLRRWVFGSNYRSPETQTDLVHVELHHDGSSAFAVCVGEWMRRSSSPEGTRGVPLPVLSSAVADAVAVAVAHARARGDSGVLTASATLLAPDEPWLPLVATDNRMGFMTVSHFEPVAGSRRVWRFTPVRATLSAEEGVDSLREVARQIDEDIEHQFGVNNSCIPSSS